MLRVLCRWTLILPCRCHIQFPGGHPRNAQRHVRSVQGVGVAGFLKAALNVNHGIPNFRSFDGGVRVKFDGAGLCGLDLLRKLLLRGGLLTGGLLLFLLFLLFAHVTKTVFQGIKFVADLIGALKVEFLTELFPLRFLGFDLSFDFRNSRRDRSFLRRGCFCLGIICGRSFRRGGGGSRNPRKAFSQRKIRIPTIHFESFGLILRPGRHPPVLGERLFRVRSVAGISFSIFRFNFRDGLRGRGLLLLLGISCGEKFLYHHINVTGHLPGHGFRHSTRSDCGFGIHGGGLGRAGHNWGLCYHNGNIDG